MTPAAWYVRTHLICQWYFDTPIRGDYGHLIFFCGCHPLGGLIRAKGVG